MNINDIQELLAIISSDESIDVLSWIGKKEISPSDVPKVLISASNYAIKQGMMKQGKKLLEIVIDKLDSSYGNKVALLLGTICFNEGDFNSARNYYSRLPLNESNFFKYVRTFVEQGDLDGLFKICEDLFEILKDPSLNNIIQNAINELIILRYNNNISYLQKIDPTICDQIRLLGFPTNYNDYGIKLSNSIIPTGEFCADNNSKDLLSAFAIRCTTIPQIKRFLSGIYTEHPVFYMHMFYIFIDLNMLNVSLTLFDFSIMIKCDYIFKFFDLNCFELQFHDTFFKKNVPFPTINFSFDETDQQFFNEKLLPLFKKINIELTISIMFYKDKLKKLYPDNFYLSLNEKIKSNSLKILLMTSRFTTFLKYCTKDMADAFERLGIKVEVLIEKEDEPLGTRKDFTYKHIYGFNPDIIFSIDHLRYEDDLPKTIPFITWIQDLLDNIFEIKDENLLSETDYLYCSSSLWQKQLLGLPAYKNKKINILTHLLNQRIYYPIDCIKKYDVTYVAHLNMPQLYWAAYIDTPDSSLSEEEFIHRKLIRYLESKPLKSLTIYYSGNDDIRLELWKDFFCFIGKMAPNLDKNLHKFIQNIVIVVARIKPLKHLIDHGINLRVFGNGWDKHPWFKHMAMGPVNNGPDLNRLINETKINLNINPAMSFHNKVAEVTGASAFFLTRNIGEYDLLPIDMFFKQGEEVILFENEKDLLEKVIYYLDHEEERKEIAHRAHLKALKEFTFDAAAKRILRDVFDICNI